MITVQTIRRVVYLYGVVNTVLERDLAGAVVQLHRYQFESLAGRSRFHAFRRVYDWQLAPQLGWWSIVRASSGTGSKRSQSK